MIKSRFNNKVVFYLLAGAASTFLLSLFLIQLFIGVLTIMWLAEKWEEKKKDINLISAGVLLFLVIRIIAVIFSVNPAKSSEIFYKEALFYTGFFAFSFYVKTFSSAELKKLLIIAVYSSAGIALIGITRFVLKDVMRAESFSSGYTVFSSYLTTMLAFALFLKYDDRYKGITTGIILTGIITSLGRTNILIAFILIAVSFLTKNLKIKPLLIMTVLAGVVSVAAFQVNTNEVKGRIEKPAALSDRDIIYEGAKQLMWENPVIGFGPRTFNEVFPLRDKFTDKGVGGWHNDFMQIYFESGTLGLFSFLFLLSISVFVFIKQFRKKINKEILYAGSCAIAALILSALTAGFITNAVLSLVFAFVLSIQSYYLAEGKYNGE